jgi:hypothetical protein
VSGSGIEKGIIVIKKGFPAVSLLAAIEALQED